MKRVALSGAFWRYSERLCAQLVSVLVSIVLARIISVEAYGLIATVNIFITIANVFVTSGLGNALIQDQDADIKDFSTILWANLGLSLMIYLIIFIAAPFIAGFFGQNQLVPLLRVLGVGVPIAAVNSVQQAYVSKKMVFKKFFWATFGGTVISAVVGIAMAYSGFGVWALVAQYLTNQLIDTIVLAATLRIQYVFFFSVDRFKKLFDFGWKLLITNLVDTLFNSARSFIIGKEYSQTDLAYYNKAEQFPNLIVANINSTLSSVMFPMISAHQNEPEIMRGMSRRVIQTSSFLVIPAMAGLAMVSDNFVVVLLTDKWRFCVPYLQIACLIYMMIPLQTLNLEITKAVGRSDIILKNDVIKKIIEAVLIIFAMKLGVIWFALFSLFGSILALIINAWHSKKLIGYSLLQQITDISGTIFQTLLMCVAVYLVGNLSLTPIFKLSVQILIGIVVYGVASIAFKNEALLFFWKTIKEVSSGK